MKSGGMAWRRLGLAIAGLFGAVGVTAAAAATHGGEPRNLGAIASIGLAHGPALLALVLAGRGKMLALAAVLLAAGTALFIGDLGLRAWLARGLFPGAAPLGGLGMIGGWLAIAAAAPVWRPEPPVSKN